MRVLLIMSKCWSSDKKHTALFNQVNPIESKEILLYG